MNINTTALVPAATSFTFITISPVYTHTITFSGTLTNVGAEFNKILYENLDVNTKWISGQSIGTTESRMLAAETIVTHTILFDRGIPIFTSQVIIELLVQVNLHPI